MKKLTKYREGHDLFPRVIITIIILTLGRMVEMFYQGGWIIGSVATLCALIIAVLLECAFEVYCKDRVWR